MPERIQLKRTKGWRMPENTVKVDRSTEWGNFYLVGKPMDRDMIRKWGFTLREFRNLDFICPDAATAVRRFAAVVGLNGTWTVKHIRQELRGKNLACWCKPGEPCHADVLLAIANGSD